MTDHASPIPPQPPPHWTDGYVLANGIRIHYWRTGGGKPALLLAHGYSDDGLSWAAFAKELEADYDIIMADARGHGLTDPPTPADSPDAQCEDLAGLIRELGLERPILMGHSMGSSSVAWFAARYPDVPRAVILEDPLLGPWTGRSADPAEVQKRRAGILAQNNRSYAELLAECRAKNPQWEPAECEWWVSSKRRFHPDLVLRRSGDRPKTTELLAQIAAPTLILKAAAEGDLRKENEAAANHLANGRILHVAGAGHCVRRDRKAEALQAVREFLAGV
ncbi:MAG: alpha/beta hydrolase [Lentisphaeria bacterium]|jgi:pimeloyl-ACP methyl ester carboxylesterase|nr:alpha/beta hydrolase [Lentisphaeria bacterium]